MHGAARFHQFSRFPESISEIHFAFFSKPYRSWKCALDTTVE